MQLVTIRNNIYMIQNFNSEQLLGAKWAVIEILFVFIFRREKINQLKASKIPRRFLLIS